MLKPDPAVEQIISSEDKACCIFWTVSTFTQAQPSTNDEKQLHALHSEIVACADLVHARILEDNATSGLVLCRELESADMSQEDVAVRFGQLICRWASMQQPALNLRVGVDIGTLKSFDLPSCGRRTFTGNAPSGAHHLAHISEQVFMVHLSRKVRERLSKLSRLKMMVSPHRQSYYLDISTKVQLPEDNAPNVGHKRSGRRKFTASMTELMQAVVKKQVSESSDDMAVTRSDSVLLQNSGATRTNADASAMSLDDFTQLLSDHKVPLSDFGKGDAKTLEEFYTDVVVDKDSFLIVTKNGDLERVKELVRIALLVRGHDNRLRELRIAAQQKEDGCIRKRNQKLAMVLKMKQGDNLKESVEACFMEKFDLSLRDQKECLAIDWDSLTFKEERMVSTTVPNIMTIYKTHNLVVNVRDKNKKEIRVLGLPGGNDFKTYRDKREYLWTWSAVGNSKEDELLDLLTAHGIESSEFTMDAFTELYDEVYETCLSSLEVQDGSLVRKIRIVKVWLHADILSVEHVLQTKKKIQKGKSDEQDKGRPLLMRMPKDLHWEKAVETILFQRLGIEAAAQGCISVDPLSYRLSEEVAFSRSFPGLKTVYIIDEVTAHVLDVSNPALSVIGLPDGHDFSFSRWDYPRGPGEAKLVIQHWCWQSLENFHEANKAPFQRSLMDRSRSCMEYQAKRRLPTPDPDLRVEARCSIGSSGTVLEKLLKGKKTDWVRAKKAAVKIRDKSYTCREFYDDVSAAFPELLLYIDDAGMSSGRSGDDEYQRTMGAMFAVYWLMRLHLDGAQCFSYGLGQDWNLRRRPGGHGREDESEWEARKAFHEQVHWDSLAQLLADAGLLLGSNGAALPRKRPSWLLGGGDPSGSQHDEERTLAMLVLTAIHDIMKSPRLLPVVTKSAFRGYQVGETIHDHDIALAYVLERQPKLLPSYAGLPKEHQASVLFSQSKMEYNMGWLVQGEAPPGALLRKLREVVGKGEASPKDVAFYFVHWFTDLAGAEPCPLEGCEKFVLKFPRKVLNQFLQSFAIIQNISPQRTETEILEAYITWRWQNHEPPLPEPPTGFGAVARMRLVMMRQGDSQAVLDGFDALPNADRRILSEEMALTGINGQFFECEPPQDQISKGPALLIYYGPALMQNAGKENPHLAMRVLAEVFRQARALWPLQSEHANETMTVRIDALKVLTLSVIFSRDAESVWVLTKLSHKEAAVQLLPLSKVKETDWSMTRTLAFHEEEHINWRSSVLSSLAP